MLQQLYDGDVMSEEALLAWAEEKKHADESDKVYLKKVRMQWRRCVEWMPRCLHEA